MLVNGVSVCRIPTDISEDLRDFRKVSDGEKFSRYSVARQTDLSSTLFCLCFWNSYSNLFPTDKDDLIDMKGIGSNASNHGSP